MKRFDPCEVEGNLLRIVGFVQERRRIRDERLLEIGREPLPAAGPERHRFDELPGGTGIVPGSDAFDHGTDPLADSSSLGATEGRSRAVRTAAARAR